MISDKITSAPQLKNGHSFERRILWLLGRSDSFHVAILDADLLG